MRFVREAGRKAGVLEGYFGKPEVQGMGGTHRCEMWGWIGPAHGYQAQEGLVHII